MIYKTSGVCSKEIHIELENGIIKDLSFTGGCSGNLKGLALFALGRTPDEVIKIVDGIHCGARKTSCPDQLAIALRACL